uniref:Cadherin domain-containing protein n=1 Tax=Leptobrachium leishanense TaxID=445787 RepID=A0A8C5MEQ0_9ANUR
EIYSANLHFYTLRLLFMYHVDVEIEDINDNHPAFSAKEYSFSIAESRLPGSRFPLEVAVDPDVGTNSVTNYELNGSEYFTLEFSKYIQQIRSLELVLKKSLDREHIPVYNLTLVAFDGGKPRYNGTTQLIINVYDINDNTPTFNQPFYQCSVTEHALNGTLVIKLNATDLDKGKNGEILYIFSKLVPIQLLSIFTLHKYTGEIKVNGELDYENTNVYELHVDAVDNGDPQLTGHCKVIVSVVDVNDNPPQMTVTSLSVPVPEDAPQGTTVAIITVHDRDSGENGRVNCHISEPTAFKINPSLKGDFSLTVDTLLDRETQSEYVVVIIAHDGGFPSLSSSTVLTIIVSDVNDNAPQFPMSVDTIFIQENNPPGFQVYKVSAFDPDMNQNSFITYSLIDNTINGIPISSYMSLELVLKKSLDREMHAVHNLTLTAFDGGKPRLSGTTQIMIIVEDLNDNAPSFDKPFYQCSVTEGAPKGTLVFKLNATDLDQGKNGEISYDFNKLVPEHVKNVFSLDKHTGEIRVIGDIDFETSNLFEIQIDAVDGGDYPMVGHCKLLVSVVDINDNPPEMTVTSLAVPVPEDAPQGTIVAIISVHDKDSGVNGRVNCQISEPAPFKINPAFTGDFSLTVDALLDRETQSEYEVVITAKDEGSPPLSSSKIIKIIISDVNDNAPKFDQKTNTIFIKENNPPGSLVFTVSATDPDIKQNSFITYSLIDNTVNGIPISSYISVNPENGNLYALLSFDYEQVTYFQCNIKATDAGLPSLNSTLTLNIFILDVNDNSPTFSPLSVNGVSEVLSVTTAKTAQVGQLITKVKAVDLDCGAEMHCYVLLPFIIIICIMVILY